MDTLIQKIFFQIMKIINFRGDLTDNSAKKEALVLIVMTELHSRFVVTIMMPLVAQKMCEQSRTTAFVYPVYPSQYQVLVRGKLCSSCNVTCSEADPAIPDMCLPSVLVAPVTGGSYSGFGAHSDT